MEKIDLTNPDLSEEEKLKYKELAERLKAVAPGDVVVQKIIKSLELGYPNAAKNYYLSNLDKFRQVSEEALRIIKEELE